MERLPLLLALQLCPLDSEAGWSLLRLIADLCPEERYRNVDLLVALRADTRVNMQAVAYAGRRFGRTHTFRSPRDTKGWPAGPNALAADTWHWFAAQTSRQRWPYQALFFIEADGLPMHPQWLARITEEWQANAMPVMGHWDHRDTQEDHVNGNCVIHRSFARQHMHFPNAPRDLAWDYHWRKEMVGGAHPSRLIFNDYKLGTPENPLLSDDQLLAPRYSARLPGEKLDVAYLHGAKCWERAHRLIRERNNLPVSG